MGRKKHRQKKSKHTKGKNHNQTHSNPNREQALAFNRNWREYTAKCRAEGIPIPPHAGDNYNSRNSILVHMGYSSYSEYLHSDLWQSIVGQLLPSPCRCCHTEKAVSILPLACTKKTLLGKDLTNLIPICSLCDAKISHLSAGKKRLHVVFHAYIGLAHPHLTFDKLFPKKGQTRTHPRYEHEIQGTDAGATTIQDIPIPPEKRDCYIERNRLLREHLGFESYPHYLASPLWKDIKHRGFREHGRFCRICNKYANILHHISYDLETLKGIRLDRLVPVCELCHHAIEFDLLDGKRDLHGAYWEYIRLAHPSAHNRISPPNTTPLSVPILSPPIDTPSKPSIGRRAIRGKPPSPLVNALSSAAELLRAAQQGFRPDT